MLSWLREKFADYVGATWTTDQETQARLVALYRDYVDGNHRAKLTPEMRKMLRIDDTRLDQFNLNYCSMVVAAMADRLTLSVVEADNPAASGWAAEMLSFNRLDGLQMDANEAALRDGVTYLMVGYDNAARMPVITHEPAYDGDNGMIAVWDRQRTQITAAAKLWHERDERRINVYLPDRVEKYTLDAQGGIRLLESAQWAAGVVPLVALTNRGRLLGQGTSEIVPVIPIQDALNRTLVSMVMTAELSGFPIRVAEGFAPPANLTPGMWLTIGENGLSKEDRVGVSTMEQAQLVPFISQAQFLIEQIGTITRTPLPGLMGGDSASGESLKQREIGLLSKVKRFQVKAGNAWEDVVALAGRIQATYGSPPPAAVRWYARWEDAQIRNNTEIIDNALKIADRVSEREFLMLVAPALGWDEPKVDAILVERAREAERQLEALTAGLPRYDQAEVIQ